MNRFSRPEIPSPPILPSPPPPFSLFVISAPSGAGKTTIVDAVRKTSDLVYSVSCTTRPPRAGETDGEDYQFL